MPKFTPTFVVLDDQPYVVTSEVADPAHVMSQTGHVYIDAPLTITDITKGTSLVLGHGFWLNSSDADTYLNNLGVVADAILRHRNQVMALLGQLPAPVSGN